VRVLLDECIDWRLGRELASHEVKTARQMGWTTLKNGELLALASAQFDVFVTVDRNLSFQQDIVSFSIAVVVLQARTNRLADLRSLVPSLLSAIEATPPASPNSSASIRADSTELSPLLGHPREGGGPGTALAWGARDEALPWIPAFAGMTSESG
jgi:hypothetical protein